MSDGKPAPEKIDRPTHLKSLSPDATVAAILRLCMEVSVLRDRLRTHEALLAEHGLLSPDAVDDYAVPAAESKLRNEANQTLIEQIVADLTNNQGQR